MEKILNWADRRHFISVRALVLYTVLWIFVAAFFWASDFASTSTKDGAQIAMIIAAVNAPLTLVLPWVFGTYMKAKKDEPK